MSLRRVKLRSPSVVLQAKTSGQLSLAPAPRVRTKHAWFSNAGMSTNVGSFLSSSPAASPLSFFQRWNMSSVGGERGRAARLPLRNGRTLGVGKDPECPPGA